jgi:hypothetical protein
VRLDIGLSPRPIRFTPAPCVARARAVELLCCPAEDGLTEPIECVDATIAKLRIVRETAAIEVPEPVARKLKRAL